MGNFKVGVQLQPQHCGIEELRAAWKEADRLGVDSIWTWDHFYPLYGEPDGSHYEGYSLLAAMAVDTEKSAFGMLVTCNSYRNADHLADIARTVDQLGGGRHILGIGAGWFERDYNEYGYRFGTAGWRLRELEKSLERIKARLARLNPGPRGKLPILIGGGGEKVTLRLVAQYADMFNTFRPADNYAHKNNVLNRWCEKVGRDPNEIERTCSINAGDIGSEESYLEAGAQHLILGMGAPFDFAPVERLLSARDA
jgi:probable F420-dependent oxidoreductase